MTMILRPHAIVSLINKENCGAWAAHHVELIVLDLRKRMSTLASDAGDLSKNITDLELAGAKNGIIGYVSDQLMRVYEEQDAIIAIISVLEALVYGEFAR